MKLQIVTIASPCLTMGWPQGVGGMCVETASFGAVVMKLAFGICKKDDYFKEYGGGNQTSCG